MILANPSLPDYFKTPSEPEGGRKHVSSPLYRLHVHIWKKNSTLDYALRAKSIKNKLELNQRMSRNSLLKEHVAETEHLKADLYVEREKNGIFFPDYSTS
jgi:hypothetical protein